MPTSTEQPFPVDADEVFVDLRNEIGSLTGTIAILKSQLRAAQRQIEQLHASQVEAAAPPGKDEG